MLIYKATNIVNGKVYIGQTVKTLEERKAGHIESSKNPVFRFHKAIARYGIDNFKWEVIDTATSIDELNQKEGYWIEFYNSYRNGYNGTKGDLNPMNCSYVKEKHDKTMRSEEVRQKISNTMKQHIRNGEFFTEEHRKKISEKLKGNKHGLGKKRPQSAIKATIDALKKAVYCIDKDGNFVKEFEYVKDAAQWLKDKYPERSQDLTNLKNKIKESYVKDRYYFDYKWIYK